MIKSSVLLLAVPVVALATGLPASLVAKALRTAKVNGSYRRIHEQSLPRLEGR